MPDFVRDLDTPLLRLNAQDDFFTPRQSFGGVCAFGGIGEGKTSSSKWLAGAYLRAGYGGVITAVKPDEIELWKNYCKQHNREKSLIIFDGENEQFNFIEYELARAGVDGLNSVADCILRILDAARMAGPSGSGRGEMQFFQDAKRQAIQKTLAPLYASTGTLDISEMMRFLATAPRSRKDTTSGKWQDSSFMHKHFERAMNNPVVRLPEDVKKAVFHFWGEEWPEIPEETRGNISITVSTVLDRFRSGRLRRAFVNKTTLVPELCYAGAVIVLAMPTTVWNEDGIIAQQLFKFMFSRAVMARNSLAPIYRERPLFLWSDEAQETCHATDGDFLGICRQSNCSVNYLSQSLPAFYSRIGGDNPRDSATNLVDKFKTFFFHGNACNETNEWAAKKIGKVYKRHYNYSQSDGRSWNDGMSFGGGSNHGTSHNAGVGGSSTGHGSTTSHNSGYGSSSGTNSNWGVTRGQGATESQSRGYSESMEFAIEPGDFARHLRNGGPSNNHEVTAIMFQTSRQFHATGTNYMEVTFRQR